MPPLPPSSPPHFPDPRHGEFRDGYWRCNCDPRLNADLKTVRKDTKDYGRRFWCCPKQRGQGNRCNMFIFLDDANRRERECLMTNGRSEMRQTTLDESIILHKGKPKPPRAAVNRVSTPGSPAASSSLASPPRSPNKPSAPAETSTLKRSNRDTTTQHDEFYDTTSDEDDQEDEEVNHHTMPIPTRQNNAQSSAMANTPTTQPGRFERKRSFEDNFLDDLSSSGEEELRAATEMSCRTANTLGKQRDAFTTPSVTRTTNIENGMPTPSLTKGKSVRRVLQFKDEETGEGSAAAHKRQCLEHGQQPPHASTSAQLFGTDAVIDQTSSPPSSQEPVRPSFNLKGEVLGLLESQGIPASVRAELAKTLTRYESQAKGYEQGRDAARKASKEAKDRCAQLQGRVEDLENAREALRAKLLELCDGA
ncbi:hypothetical protein F4802DRAFT_249032 [Xylaria palmicola]|nr:hypothetical protein F4802DRAFT_249032 [Xylaria palmicola]